MSSSFSSKSPKPQGKAMYHNTPEFEKFVQDEIEKWRVTGLSVAVIQDGETHTKAYGYATLPSEKVTKDTIFDLASTSKCTTAAAVALLVQDEQYPDVQWTTPVSKLLPDFVLPDPRLTEEVTLEDILSHRSGIACHDESYLGVRSNFPDDAKSLTLNLRNLEFVKPLRTSFIYSNIMFSVATYLVESLTGLPYAEYLKTKLWGPLGMTNTFHDIPDVEANNAMDRKATGYHWNPETASYMTIDTYPQPEGQGAGSIYSSAGDYAKWIRALLKRSLPLTKTAHKDFIKPRSIYSFDEEYAIPHGSHPLYALGLVYETYRGQTLISHSGSVPGFESVVAYMPDHDWGFVSIGSTDDASYVNETLKWTLIDDMLGVPVDDRVDWSTFHRRWKGKEIEEDNEVKPDFTRPEHPEPLSLPLEALAGRYHDVGYKDLVLEMKDAKLIADCDDRCFPFVLTFEHLTANKFLVENRGTMDGVVRKWRGEVRIEGDRATCIGVEFEEDVKGGLIWFEKTQ